MGQIPRSPERISSFEYFDRPKPTQIKLSQLAKWAQKFQIWRLDVGLRLNKYKVLPFFRKENP